MTYLKYATSIKKQLDWNCENNWAVIGLNITTNILYCGHITKIKNMNIVQSIINFLSDKDTNKAADAPEGICPNCWGRQEYAGEFYDALKQENLDVNSIEANTGWVNAYATKHLEGIALQRSGNGNEVVCGKCKVSYQNAENKSAS